MSLRESVDDRPLVVEVAGPAGAGKTTLIKALTKDGSSVVAPLLRFRSPADFATLLPHTVSLTPTIMRDPRVARELTWRQVKKMAHLNAWFGPIERRTRGVAPVALIDHGPLYILATLRGFGTGFAEDGPFWEWWRGRLEYWAARLDVVVFLDASDDVLIRRIRKRSTPHTIRASDRETAVDFLDRYRRSFADVRRMVEGVAERPLILDAKTERLSKGELVGAVRDTLHATRPAIFGRSVASSREPSRRTGSAGFVSID